MLLPLDAFPPVRGGFVVGRSPLSAAAPLARAVVGLGAGEVDCGGAEPRALVALPEAVRTEGADGMSSRGSYGLGSLPSNEGRMCGCACGCGAGSAVVKFQRLWYV